jgi:hypothetical protein
VEEEEKEYKTPSAPGFFLIRPLEPEKVDDLTQKWFRLNIGCLLYLVKLSRPDLGNSVRELSKVMDGAAPGHVKELKRLIQFVRNTKGVGLKMQFSEEKSWEVEAYSDSDYAGDKEHRKSVTGMVYVALCETVWEVKFISQVLESLEIEYKKPIRVHVDNIGAIFLSENRNSGERTKHIDIKYHYIREQIDVGLIEVKFVKSEDNLADLFTKNLKGELFECHASKMVNGWKRQKGRVLEGKYNILSLSRP